MSFEAFENSILSPDLKHVARHWNEARGSRQMPAWTDIRPSHMPRQLTIVWAYRYDRATDDFVGRLSGNLIDQIFGRNLRGVPMSELYPPRDYPRLLKRTKRVFAEPALFRGEGLVFKHVDRFGQGERIILPLGDGTASGDGIFGATVYEPVGGQPVPGVDEIESWFSL